MVKFSTTKERQRTLKKELSDRLLGPVGYPGRIALEGAPAANFLQSLSGAESISDNVGIVGRGLIQSGCWMLLVPAPNRGMGTYCKVPVRTGSQHVPSCIASAPPQITAKPRIEVAVSQSQVKTVRTCWKHTLARAHTDT